MPAASLAGRVAVVTGGSRGIGAAIAHGLVDEGAAVVLCSRHEDACLAVAAEMRSHGGSALGLGANVSDPASAASVMARTLDEFGRIDILVNNAATNPQFGALIDADESALLKIFQVNLLAPWRFTREAVRGYMGEHGGSVINIASINALRPEPLLGGYGASKAALIHMTRTLARELGPRAVRVNAIAPGLIETDFARALLDDRTFRESYVARTPLGRVGTPSDTVAAALYLAGEQSSYVTGSVLTVDGGYTV